MERCDCPLPGPCRAKYFLLPANQTCAEAKKSYPYSFCEVKDCRCYNKHKNFSCPGPKKEIPMFDPKKPVVAILGDGSTRAARVLCTDAKGPYPIIALTDWGPKGIETFVEHAWMFDANGYHVGQDHGFKLVNIKVKKWKWVYRMHPYGPLEVSGPCSEKMATAIWSPSALMGRIQESMIEE